MAAVLPIWACAPTTSIGHHASRYLCTCTRPWYFLCVLSFSLHHLFHVGPHASRFFSVQNSDFVQDLNYFEKNSDLYKDSNYFIHIRKDSNLVHIHIQILKRIKLFCLYRFQILYIFCKNNFVQKNLYKNQICTKMQIFCTICCV